MKRTAVALIMILAFLFSMVAGLCLIKNARAETTLVVPDDYATIQDAINAAAEGDTIFVKKGTYEEPAGQTLVINKTLTLIGEGANSTTISLHPQYNETWIITRSFRTYANAITINTNNVKLEGLTISTPGGDICIKGDRTEITNTNIATQISIEGSQSNITQNTITRISINGSHSTIVGNNISGGSIHLSGDFNMLRQNAVLVDIIIEYANSNTISNNTCTHFLLGYPNNCSYNVVFGNKIEPGEHMGDYGMLIGGSHNVFYDNQIANFNRSHRYAVWLDGFAAENNTFYHNNFVNNNSTVYIENENSTANSNSWDNGKEGNYWDDYNGTDSNRDGIGDTPYVIGNGNVDNYPLIAPYDMENDTIVLPPPEPFPIAIVIVIAVAVVCVGLLVYFKKHKQ